MADIRTELSAITAQISKGTGEVVAQIEELQTKVEQGTITVDDLAPLKEAAQRLDDVVPDVSEEVPTTPGEDTGTVEEPSTGDPAEEAPVAEAPAEDPAVDEGENPATPE